MKDELSKSQCKTRDVDIQKSTFNFLNRQHEFYNTFQSICKKV